jgi:hypothetical protein
MKSVAKADEFGDEINLTRKCLFNDIYQVFEHSFDLIYLDKDYRVVKNQSKCELSLTFIETHTTFFNDLIKL